jgi:hypothetical protein
MGLRLLVVSSLALLSGCGWLFGDSSANPQNARPGVDRQGPPTGTLPAASGQHDAGLAATDPVGNPQIGSIVGGKGGQKAQKDAADKEAAERDAKEREERQKREAEERDAKAKEQPEEQPKGTPEKRTLPGRPSAAEWGNPDNPGKTAATTPAPAKSARPASSGASAGPPSASGLAPAPAGPLPPPAPVTSAPVAPPAQAPPPATGASPPAEPPTGTPTGTPAGTPPRT